MIGRIQGTLLQKEPPMLLVDTGGIAYEISAPMTTFYNLPDIGNKVTLFTHLVVRDDAHLLYGFSSESVRTLFRILLKVSGIGPRVALALLSGLSESEFIHCIAEENIGRITQVPGIGRKTAERLIVELRDKIDLQSAPATSATRGDDGFVPDAVSEAVSALVSLGYKPNEANRAIRNISTSGKSSEDIIRQALQAMTG
jgi:holliday junction DNA helicase RuvA